MADGSFALLIVTIITSYVHTLRSEYIILYNVQYAEKYRFFFLVVHVLVLFAYLTISYGTSAIPVCIQ